MTRLQLYKAGGSLVVIFLGWYFGRRKPAPAVAGEVTLGTPTVSGSGSQSFGGTDYGVIAPVDSSLEPLPSPEVAALNARAAEAIANWDANHPDAP